MQIDDETSEEVSLLNKLEEILPVSNSGKAARIIFHGVNGENFQSEESPSWCNPHEAAQIFYYLNEFYRLGLNHKNIGIITPYIKQVINHTEALQLFLVRYFVDNSRLTE